MHSTELADMIQNMLPLQDNTTCYCQMICPYTMYMDSVSQPL